MLKQPERPSVYFDFDKTLLDTNLFFSILMAALNEAYGKDLHPVLEQYENTLDSRILFNHEVCFWQIAFYLANEDTALGEQIHARILADFLKKQDYYTPAIYPEVLEVLQQLQQSYLLKIFTEGYPPWQRLKLLASGLGEYLNGGIIAPSKRTPQIIQKIEEDSVVVDDNPDVIAVLLLSMQSGEAFTPVWLNRKKKKRPKTIPQSTQIITDLTELPAFLKTLE